MPSYGRASKGSPRLVTGLLVGTVLLVGAVLLIFPSCVKLIFFFCNFTLSDGPEIDGHGFSQRHPSNWVDADEDDDDDGDENELCVQSTPPYYEEQ